MTEEEKKAIETLKYLKEDKYILKNLKAKIKAYEDNDDNDECGYVLSQYEQEAIDTILDLIEKLQKENEEYKKQFVPTPEHPISVEYQTSIFVDKRDYISKNIIRKKLDYVDNNIHLVNPYSREDIYEMGKLHGIGEFCEELLMEE